MEKEEDNIIEQCVAVFQLRDKLKDVLVSLENPLLGNFTKDGILKEMLTLFTKKMDKFESEVLKIQLK